MFLIILLHALFGTSIPISKYLLNFTKPILLAGLRMTVAGIILILYKIASNRTHFSVLKNSVWIYFQIIFFGVYLKYVLRYWALDYMSATKMAFLFNISPFFAAFFSYVAFHEHLSLHKWIGLIIGFVGFIPMLITSSPTEQLVGELMYISWPELAVLVAIICHCIGMIIARKLIRDKNHSASLTNGVRMFGGGVLALFTSLIFEGKPKITHVATFSGWFIAVILISNIICHNIYLNLLKRYTVTFLTFAEFLSPLFVAFYGWLFLGETISWHYVVSTMFIIFGLYIFYKDELKEIHQTHTGVVHAK